MAQEINILVKPWANPIPNSNSEDDIKKRWANSIPKIENILDYVYLSHCVHIHYVYLGSSMQIKTPDVRRLFIQWFSDAIFCDVRFICYELYNVF